MPLLIFQLDKPVPEYLLQETIDKNLAVLIVDGVFQAMSSDYFAKHGEQPFHYQKEVVAYFRSAIAMPKDFYILKHILDPHFDHLVDNGLVQKLLSKYVPPDGKFQISFMIWI